MEYLILTGIYLIFCIAYIQSISSVMIAGLTLVLLHLIYLRLQKKNISRNSSLLVLMSATIPISFRNIFGGEFSANPLTWFYIIGAFYLLNVLISNLKKSRRFTINIVGILVLFLIGLSIIPLLISTNFNEGAKEYLTYLFFLLLLLSAIIDRSTLSIIEYNGILKAYIFGGVFASCGIVFQYIMYNFFSKSYFRIEFYGAARKYFSFMFYDMSSATVYLATVAFLIIFHKRKKVKSDIILCLLIVVSMALSSARAGLASLFSVLFLYALTKKGFLNKVILIILSLVFMYVSISLLNNVRGLESSLSYITYDAGRFEGYIDGLRIFASSPLFGIGYDLGYVMKQMGLVVPHFALINMLAQTGVIITSLFIIIIAWLFFLAKRKALMDLKWVIIVSLIGSMIIPGFFNSRFFTVIAMLVVLRNDQRELSRN